MIVTLKVVLRIVAAAANAPTQRLEGHSEMDTFYNQAWLTTGGDQSRATYGFLSQMFSHPNPNISIPIPSL